MPWQQLRFKTENDEAELLGELLTGLGASSTSLTDAKDDPIYEPKLGETPLWNEVILDALFMMDIDTDAVLEKLRIFKPGVSLLGKQVIEDQNWQQLCEVDFQPLQLTDKLWIIPTWSEPVDPKAVNIILSPGLAFGTGKHATTALCLKWLSAQIDGGETVIDYGCGSGILAIAAALLGADKVYATDIDPQAIQATIRNAEQNGVRDKIEVDLPEATQMPKADILVANILANPLMTLAPTLHGHLKTGGKMALSGILAEQAEAVKTAFKPYLDLPELAEEMDWTLLSNK